MAEDLPEGISVDSVVGLAKVDETSVDWSLVFEGIAENLVEREQLAGGASGSAEAGLVFEDSGLHSRGEAGQEDESVAVSRDGEETDAAIVAAVKAAILVDPDNGGVFPILWRTFGGPHSGVNAVEPCEKAMSALFEHLSGDEAYTGRLSGFEASDSVGDFFEGWARFVIGRVDRIDGIEEMIVEFGVGFEEQGVLFRPTFEFISWSGEKITAGVIAVVNRTSCWAEEWKWRRRA